MNNNSSNGDEVLGRGIAFPLRLAGGAIAMNAYETQVEQSIRLILRTAQGERVMRPKYGAGADQLAFEPMTGVTAALVQHRIAEALMQYEPRIEIRNVSVVALPEMGELRAEIAYRVKRTDSVFNLVYPFYLERGEA
jgi:phage baseplate assembly protein W